MNSEVFYINESDLELAKKICLYIKNPEIRNRATANAIAANIASNYFENYNVDIESGLHNNANILERIEISDIYINEAYIDVRLYFNDNELCVPKFNYDNDIIPVAYMFIKVDDDLSGGTVTGFITPDSIKNDAVNGYYPIDESDLVSFYDIEPLLVTPTEISFDDADSKIYDIGIDKNLDLNLIKALISSKYLRQKYLIASKAESILNLISIEKPVEIEDKAESLIDSQNNNDGTELLPENDNLTDIDKINIGESIELDLTASSDIEPIENSLELPSDESLTENDFEIIEQDEALDIINVDDVKNDTLIQDEDDFNQENIDNNDEPVTEIVDIPDSIQESSDIIDNLETETKNEDIITDESSIDNEPVYSIYQEEFSTETTPSLESLEKGEDNTNLTDVQDDSINNDTKESIETLFETENSVNPDISEDALDQDLDFIPDDNTTIDSEQGEQEEIVDTEENVTIDEKKKKMPILPVIALIIAIAGIGYFSYTKLSEDKIQESDLPEQVEMPSVKTAAKVDNAMPNETINDVTKINKTEEGNSVSIPAIEQNLDASIVLSNLSVSWEVPSSYASNNHVKRYLTKLGKIIQLNLKTELLLLSKPPITNKIAVELEYSKNTKNFVVKGITSSSGEKTIDDTVVETIKKALAMNLNTNLDNTGKLQGTTTLVIHL